MEVDDAITATTLPMAPDLSMDETEKITNASTTTRTTTTTTTEIIPSMKRTTLHGIWKLDKTRGKWSMRGYLETLHVNELAIQAHEKGEVDHETFHTIILTPNIEHENDNGAGTADDTPKNIQIIKRSRVNNDLTVSLDINKEYVEYLQPGQRFKKLIATTENFGQHIQISSSLVTMNGMTAHVTDIKRLIQEENGDSGVDNGDGTTTTTTKSVLVQELTIVNEQTKQSNTTVRYFIPFHRPLQDDDR